MSPLIQYLSRFCAEHRLEKKYLIVSSYRAGHQIGEALAKEGGAWIDLHFATPALLAQKTAAPALQAQETRLISQASALFLVDGVFQRLKDAKKLKYFGQVEATSGLVRALRSSIFALRMAGWKSRDLKPARFISNLKGEELALILREYEEDLDKRKLTDLPGLYLLALKEAKKGQTSGAALPKKELYLCLQDRPFEYLETEFLKALAGKSLTLVPGEAAYGLRRPPWVDQTPTVPTPAPTTDAERLPWLFSPKDAPPPFGDGTIQLFSAVGLTNECREILRRIITERIALDDVEIIHPRGPAYPSLLYALSAKAGLPLTFAEGIPLAFTSPGKVFTGLVEWLEHDYLASALCDLIEAGALELPSGNGHAGLTPLKASRYLRSAMIGWGKERYADRLETLIEDIKTSAESAGHDDERGGGAETAQDTADRQERASRQVSEVQSLLSLVREFFELLPEEDEKGKFDFAALCRGIAEVIGKFASLYGDLDAEARTLLRTKLDEAAAFKTAPLRRMTAFEWLKNVGAGLTVGASGPGPGHMHLSTWFAGGRSARPLTFIAGLDQGAFPGAGIQDPILLDEERERLNADRKAPLLRTTSESLRENLWRMAAMLAGLRGRVTLSYSAYDIIEERPSFPSSVILQAARLMTGKPGLDYSALAEMLPEAQAFLPGEKKKALDETDWWLGRLAPGGVVRDGMEAVKSNFDALSRGIFARERRERPLVSEYEGKIKVDPAEVHPLLNPAIVMSASRLEKLAHCPYGYFLRYVLEVSPPEELELDESRWLSPLDRGLLLHDVYASFMREMRRRGEAVRAKKHRPVIRKIAAEVVARYKEEIPPPTESIFDEERRGIWEALDVFLATEEQWAGKCEPLLFEVTFGMGKRRRAKKAKGDAEEAEEGMDEPARLDIGGGRAIALAGRIDRIDRVGEGCYRVMDYKTGGYGRFKEFVEFGKGEVLQHALYAIAAEQILKKTGIDARPRVVESGYYFPTRKGEGNKIIGEFSREKFRALVADLVGILEKGHFVANPWLKDAHCADYCEYSAVCGGASAKDRAKGKKEKNPDVFGIFDRLKDYE
jgi:ATP-dependent helicase/nuclease subunit B